MPSDACGRSPNWPKESQWRRLQENNANKRPQIKRITSILADRLSAFLTLVAVFIPAYAHGLTLDLQRRDPATGATTIQKEEVDPKRVGVIAVDVWNFHWCKPEYSRFVALAGAAETGLNK
jgi:hypothetical protein